MEILKRKPPKEEKTFVEFPEADYPDLAEKLRRRDQLLAAIAPLQKEKEQIQAELDAILALQPIGHEIRCAGKRFGYDTSEKIDWKGLVEKKRPSLLKFVPEFTALSTRFYCRDL